MKILGNHKNIQRFVVYLLNLRNRLVAMFDYDETTDCLFLRLYIGFSRLSYTPWQATYVPNMEIS